MHGSELIYLSQNVICKPAAAERFPENEIQVSFINKSELELLNFPSHSQNIEKALKLTSEDFHVYGFEAKQRAISSKTIRRQLSSSFVFKKLLN